MDHNSGDAALLTDALNYIRRLEDNTRVIELVVDAINGGAPSAKALRAIKTRCRAVLS